jgi:hypothetical protein
MAVDVSSGIIIEMYLACEILRSAECHDFNNSKCWRPYKQKDLINDTFTPPHSRQR